MKKEKLIIKSYLKKNINLLYIFKNNEFTENFIKNMINNLSEKRYYKSNIYEIIKLTGFIQLNRELKYKVLYYMVNNNEEKAIEILQAQINTLYTILEWDTSLIETLVAITCLNIWFENIDLLIKNYKLSNNSQNVLLSVLNRDINNESFNNSFKNELKFILNYLPEWISKTTLYNYKETKKWLEAITYIHINNNWFISDKEWEKFKFNILKSNFIGQVIWKPSIDVDYNNLYKKLSDLNNFRKDLSLQLWNMSK